MRIVVNKHVSLSAMVASDQAAIVEHLQAREIYECTLRIPHPYLPEHFQEWLKIVAESAEREGQPMHWAIRHGEGQVIGGIGLEGRDGGRSHQAELGYWLAKPFWGHGIMTAVVHRLCEHAFTELGLVKVTAHVFADNNASARVLEKCGFQQEGYLRSHYRKDGRLVDARLFGRLR